MVGYAYAAFHLVEQPEQTLMIYVDGQEHGGGVESAGTLAR